MRIAILCSFVFACGASDAPPSRTPMTETPGVGLAACNPDRAVIVDGKPHSNATDGWKVVGTLRVSISGGQLVGVEAHDSTGKKVSGRPLTHVTADDVKVMQASMCEAGGLVAAITKWPRHDLPDTREDVFDVFGPIASDEKKDLVTICTAPNRDEFPVDRNPFSDVMYGTERVQWLTSDKWRKVVQEIEAPMFATADNTVRRAAASKGATSLAELTAKEGYSTCWWVEALKRYGSSPPN